jgi:hypothetical protein
MNKPPVSPRFVEYVFSAAAIPLLLMLYLYYPHRFPFWIIFLASIGCGAIAIVLAEVAARAVRRWRGARAPKQESAWDRWRSPF